MSAVEFAVRECFTAEEIEIDFAGDLAEANSLVKSNVYDIMILDMNVPVREDSGSPDPQGGLRFLKQIQRKANLNPPRHIVGLTAYDGLVKEHREDFNKQGWVLVKYDNTTQWEETIKEKICHIIRTESDENKTPLSLKSIFILLSIILLAAVVICKLFGIKYAIAGASIAILIIIIGFVVYFFADNRLSEKGFVNLIKSILKKSPGKNID